MPVPTQTFWSIRKLNLFFAVAALALLAAMLLLVMTDYNRAWRITQREARLWTAAMTRDELAAADNEQWRRQIEDLRTQIDALTASLPHDRIAQLQRAIDEANAEIARLTLPAAAVQGRITPLLQRIERADLAQDAAAATAGRMELSQVNAEFAALNQRLVAAQLRLKQSQSQLADLEREVLAGRKRIDDLSRSRHTLQEKLARAAPSGSAKLGDALRNAPLLDWFNPTEKVQQVVVPLVRTDYNTLTGETIDRCNTCHVNIDNPAFEETNLLLFAERAVARAQGQFVDAIRHPVVLLEFWERAAEHAEVDLAPLRQSVLDALNLLRSTAGNLPPLGSAADLPAEFARIQHLSQPAVSSDSPAPAVSLQEWHTPLGHYLADIKKALRDRLGAEPLALLRDLYRHELVRVYNDHRAAAGLPTLSANSVLLGHPRMDLYVEPESRHPMKSMGCTVCHEGSGQETQFEHTVHTPGDVWVDARTGAKIPAFLVQSTPFSPKADLPAHDAPYTHPASPDQPGQAVRQRDFWARQYHWRPVHYTVWEKPMHPPRHIESSCNKCHVDGYDLQDHAPSLFQGRQLFAQMGCANCHAVEGLKDALDIRKVGPSLAHVRHKLSPQMMASWIWSPKSFRPTTRMPHFFMLENNSSPVDILRTRVETTAITHYLMSTPPASAGGQPPTPYRPQSPPASPGDPINGKALFNTLGCQACHANLDEQGETWIVDDLVKRTNATEDHARQRFAAMDYNQRHWYAMEHLADKLERFGPELSGIGTKLLAGPAGREPDNAARARGWLYDWLRNPRHYSDNTVMPSLRLSEQEANDLAAHLLTLQRPDYRPDDFGFGPDNRPALDDAGRQMLEELVVNLTAAPSSPDHARAVLRGQEPDPATGKKHAWSVDEQLAFLGRKSIAYYGCNGCHGINGFEDAASACTNLDDWGAKDPHKLDFGYFDHAFDAQRQRPIDTFKVDHEGLAKDAPQLTADSPHVGRVPLPWEHIELERRPWLYQKLHNPRIYDRGRTTFDGKFLDAAGQAVEHFDPAGRIDVGKPYDRLKMPRFFLTDDQVRALVTFVTSLRKPLVDPALQRVTNDAGRRVIRGRQLATLYNCYGCHNIEGNTPRLWDFFDVRNTDGTLNYEHLNNAPPRLLGQGSKTQPEWLIHFLREVRLLRPWLRVRMPSFFPQGHPHAIDHTSALADYFAGLSQSHATQVRRWLAPIEQFIARNPEARWFDADATQFAALTPSVEALKALAIRMELAQPRDFDPRQSTAEDRREVWLGRTSESGTRERLGLLPAFQFMARLNDIHYPYVHTPRPDIDDDRFARGQALYNELRCYQCHAMGDEQTLIKLWKLDHPEGQAAASTPTGGDDPFGADAPAPGGDDPFGDAAPAPAARTPESTDPLRLAYEGKSAPNLSLTATRLQWNWVLQWLQEAPTMQPGTKMPQWFPAGHSAFLAYPADAKPGKESLFGHDGQTQMSYLMDFLYAAGWRNYTPGSERLIGAAAAPTPDLKLLAPPTTPAAPDAPDAPNAPPPVVAPAPTVSAPSADDAAPAPAIPPSSPPADDVADASASSTIILHDAETAPYEGDAVQGESTRVAGQVLLDVAVAPRPRSINMGVDAYCERNHKTPQIDDSLSVNEKRQVRFALVYVKNPPRKAYAAPRETALLNQVGCHYTPRVLAVMTRQAVEIRNSDNTLHNVDCQARINPRFNIGQPQAGMKEVRRFNRPEMGVLFKCQVHAWMSAHLHVMDHPFFAVTDAEGRYEIRGLPPGRYELAVWHEKQADARPGELQLQPSTLEVQVVAGQSLRADLSLKPR